MSYPQVQKGLTRLLQQLDESGLSKLIVEIILLCAVETPSENDALIAAAKRHRVDVLKVRTAVVAEFNARATKAAAKQKKIGPAKTAKATAAA